ncbi:hypothetical protein HT136_00510 [Novosphingobium profundi]|uniref:hypothetical protein n=1 Tax=Novosphingobium profundi TaxID=1774954 RepID=UPI001BDAF48B|nr:hypothetical protein [Novosphingobium profundi]MBT0666849.1 hypothetical protein [Novosphingobium profundi]
MAAGLSFKPPLPTRLLTLALALTAPTLAVLPTLAQADEPGERPTSLRALAQCRTLTDDAARLACFDRESATLIAASDQGEVAIVDKDEARKVRKSLFGFGVPRIALFEKGKDEAEETRLVSSVTAVQTLPRGYYRVTIAEGDAVWETSSRRNGQSAPKPGDRVELEPAAMGSYWLRLNGEMGVKAHRVR